MFGLLKKDMRLAGIFPDSNHSQAFKFFLNFCLLGSFVILFFATLWFLIFHAKKLTDYTESFYYNSCGWGLAILYANYVWLSNSYEDLFNELDAIVERRKFEPILGWIFHADAPSRFVFSRNIFKTVRWL